MEAVADGELLDVAELRVELGDGGARGVVLGDPALARESRAPGALDDLGFSSSDNAAPVEPVGLSIFLDQRLEIGEPTMKAGLGEWRRQMADRHRRQCAASLAPPRRDC